MIEEEEVKDKSLFLCVSMIFTFFFGFSVDVSLVSFSSVGIISSSRDAELQSMKSVKIESKEKRFEERGVGLGMVDLR